MPEKTAWRLSLLFGIAVAIVGIVTMGAFPTDGAGYDPGLGTPVYAFEMARSSQDLIAIFGTIDDPARAGRIAAMDAGNLWDYPFMICYGLFIAFFFVAAGKKSGGKVWKLLALLGVIAAIADGMENQILLGLTADIEGAPNINLLAYPVWTKFLSLGVCGVGMGAYLISQSNVGWKIAGAIAALGALLVIPGFISPTDYAVLLGNGLGLNWIIQLVFVARRSIVP